jgi:hypothetical protein
MRTDSRRGVFDRRPSGSEEFAGCHRFIPRRMTRAAKEVTEHVANDTDLDGQTL